MRRLAWVLLVVFAFAVPWEYSLDLGPPLGNVARILGLLLLVAAIPAVLQAGSFRRPGAMQWLTLCLFLWFCLSCFWTIDQMATLAKIRGYCQEFMIVWLVWEFAESGRNLRWLLKAFVAGSWVLALLTLADFRSPEAIAAGQIRFAAYGQDPNDVARFLDLAFPLAALLADGAAGWTEKILSLGFLPLGLFAVGLTASRGGIVAAAVALAGSGVILARGRPRFAVLSLLTVPFAAASFRLLIPHETLARLATIYEQVTGGDFNQRLNIWSAGWHAFVRAPLLGTGAGTFVQAAGLAPIDTAHNSALSLAVSGGLCALSLAMAVYVVGFGMAWSLHGRLRIALICSLLVWTVSSLVGTVEESRSTWLLFGLIALAARISAAQPGELAACFPDQPGDDCAVSPNPAEVSAG